VKSSGFHGKQGSRCELKEARRLKEFIGSQGTRKRGLKVLHDRPCRSTKDLKKSMDGHLYCARPCIEDKKFPAEMHGCAFQPSSNIHGQQCINAQPCIYPGCTNLFNFRTILIHS